VPDPDYGKITDARVAALKARLGLDLDPDNYLPLSDEVRANWRPRSTGFNVEVSIDTTRWLRRLHLQHRKFNFAGDTNWLIGEVVGSSGRRRAPRCSSTFGSRTSAGSS
jgi:hypothetical protein